MSATQTIDMTTAHGPGPVSRARSSGIFARMGDGAFFLLCAGCAASIIALTGWLVYQLWDSSVLSRQQFGWKFLVTQNWDPVAEDYGALPFIFGTAITSFIALLIAIPLGLGTAIFLTELAPPKVSAMLAFLVDLLAAVPSVIYGLLGVFLLVPVLKSHVVPFLRIFLGKLPIFDGPFYGLSMFTAGVVLAIMIVPFIISISREVFLGVPRELKEASFALGATRWETMWRTVLPSARRGIFGSIFLALARALGETMAVTMVIGNDPAIHRSILAPGYTVSAVIANEFSEATSKMYLSALIELGLVLFAITFVLNGLARIMIFSSGGSHE
jgi:phosphate transport system permease protein